MFRDLARNLVADMLKQLSLTDDVSSTPRLPSECRVYTRHHSDLSTTCQPTSAWGRKDSRWAATISDISLGGIRLIVRRRFEPGSGMGIELPAHDGGDPSIVLAKVVHVRALPDGTWALGCKFISELGEDELARLLPSQESPPAEQPAPAAEPGPVAPSQLLPSAPSPAAAKDSSGNRSVIAVELQLEVSPRQVISCRVRRLSAPGSWPPPAGTTLVIQANAPPVPLPPLRLEVVHSSPRGEGWILRCRLLNPPTDELLRALRGESLPGSSR